MMTNFFAVGQGREVLSRHGQRETDRQTDRGRRTHIYTERRRREDEGGEGERDKTQLLLHCCP